MAFENDVLTIHSCFLVLLVTTLNSRIPELKKERDIRVIGRLSGLIGTTETTEPDVTVELTPKPNNGNKKKNDVIRVFVTAEERGARLFSLLPWLEAGDEEEMDEILTFQWGVNAKYNQGDQDLMFKVRPF